MHIALLLLPALLLGQATAQCGSQSLPTLFAANNGGSGGWGVFFDLDVQHPLGIVLCGFDTNAGTTSVGTPFTVDVHVTAGSYVPVHGVPAAWRLCATGSGTAAGNNVPAMTTLAQPLYLPPGLHGIALYHYGLTSIRYTNGTGSNEIYSNADLVLTAGLVRSTLFGTPTAGSIFTPRVWNGTLYYDPCSATSMAGYGFLGQGCAGSLGTATLRNASVPRLGGVLTVDVVDLPLSAGIVMVGLSSTFSPFGPLPLDLGLFGAPGCPGRVSPDALTFIAGSNNTARWTFGIPNNAALQCQQFYQQVLVPDPGRNALGAVVSDAAAAVIGL